MSDMIDRQAAIKALGERPMVWVNSDYELGARNQYDADVLALETLPPAQPGWIPVTERLPKDDGDYLVTTHSGQIARYIFIGGYSEEYWRRCATAWMPLPTPWKGEQDG